MHKKGGYGYLIKWLVALGDIIVVNIIFFLYLISCSQEYYIVDHMARYSDLLILSVNLAYFVTLSIIPYKLDTNIIFFDKVIQRSLSFISLYYALLISGLSLFGANSFSWKTTLFLYLILCLIYVLWHVVIRSILKYYRSKGYNYRRIIIVGQSDNLTRAVYNELKAKTYGYKILKVLDLNMQLDQERFLLDIEEFCREQCVDDIYCTLKANQETEIVHLIHFSEKNFIRFYLVPDLYGFVPRRLKLDFLQSIPVMTIRNEPLTLLANRLVKRLFDISFSLLVLISIFPFIYIVFGVLIKLTSRGSVFFEQERTGLQGKTFKCYKFRSMIVNSVSNVQTTSENDPRITKLGSFMRRTSIDELPQFFNVLIGNMSIVGPRPHMLQETEVYRNLIDKFMIRHIIKPGITGWAQITGFRGETKTLDRMQGRVKRDIWYIENWSFLLDIKIIVVTVFQILRGDKNAY